MIDPLDFTQEALRKIAPKCGECPEGLVDLVAGPSIYPNRSDLWLHDDGTERWWFKCTCGAYVGVHRGTLKPLGTPANVETRRAREAAHAAFDPMWQKRMKLSDLTRTQARGRGYKWLAEQLGIERKACHIGEMTADMARRVVEVCRSVR